MNFNRYELWLIDECFFFCAGDAHNLDLNLGISPPSFGNDQKEVEGRIQYHPGPYDVHGRKLLGVNLFNLNIEFLDELIGIWVGVKQSFQTVMQLSHVVAVTDISKTCFPWH